MTSETTYREKGRAVVLAALMVLSVVAMSAAFAGGAAAVDSSETDTINDGDRFWKGEQLYASGIDGNNWASDETEVALIDDDGTLVREIPTEKIEGGSGLYVDIDTSELSGEYTLEGETAGPNSVNFTVNDQNLKASFSANETSLNTEEDLTLTSARNGYDVNVTAEGISGSNLAHALGVEGDSDVTVTDDVVTIESVKSSQKWSVAFDEGNFSTGEQTFTFTATDTGAEASTSIDLTSAADTSADFDANTYEQEVGDVAQFTLEPSQTDEMYVNVTEEDENYHAVLRVHSYDDADEVTVNFNTYTASTDVAGSFSAADEGEVELVDKKNNIGANNRLLPSDFELEAYVADSSEGEADATDAAVLILEDRSTDDLTTWTAPASYNVDSDIDTILEDATQSDTVANGDLLVTEVEATGVYGYMTNDAGELVGEGLNLNYTDTNDPRYSEPDQFGVNDLGDNAQIVEDAENDTFYVVADIGAHDMVDNDETWNVSFSVNESNGYIQSADDEELVSQEVDVEERSIDFASELDDEDRLEIENSENSEITAETNVAPGTEVTYRIRFPTEVTSGEAVVGEDGMATASWDFSDQEAGQEIDNIRMTETGADAEVSASGIIVQGESSAPDSFEYDVSTSPSEPVKGDDVTGTITAENPAEDTMSEDVTFTFDGEELANDTVELEGGASDTIVDGATLLENASAGDYEWELTANGEVVEDGTLTVEDPDKGDGDDGSDDGDDGGDDGTPGFGVGVALVALLGAAMLALRRQN
ncbi:hypothetical protein HTG_02980 [Natrinema mahii]|nr:hypothetical protein HTG_02980 [Natrinema mahii]